MSDETRPFEAQLAAAFEELSYPITDESDLAPNFPSWAHTRFGADGPALTPREVLLLVPDEYPFHDADEFASAIRARLREEGYLD